MEAGSHRQAAILQQALVHSVVETEPTDIPLRRASMCHDGTPVVHSIKLSRKQLAPAYRLLVEPGGVGITVPQQISYSLRVVDGLLEQLGWKSVVDDLNTVIATVFPSEAAKVNDWWGGIWLGMAAGQSHADLRIYMNLRHGEAVSRWQRVGDVLGWFSDASLEPLFKQWVEKVAPHAIPVGIGIVIAEGQIRGVRIYTGLYQPSLDVLRAIRMDHQSSGAPPENTELDSICNTYTGSFGDFSPQSVTVGYDFRIGAARLLEPQISRTKVDISCQLLASESKAALPALLSQLFADLGYEAGLFEAFLADVNTHFGGYNIEFFSAGFAGNLEHVTVYTKPDGYAGT